MYSYLHLPSQCCHKNLTVQRGFGEILEKAGHPLTETQIEQLNELGSGPESRRKMMDILDDNQKEALRKSWGNRRTRTRGTRSRESGVPFHRNIAEILKNTEYPLTDEQLEQLKDIQPGPESRQKMMEILNDDQKEALRKARENRRSMDEEQRAAGLKYITQALEDANCALTESQLEQLKEIQQGREFFRTMMDILDDKQREALRNSSAMRLMFIAPALENAGCPLTESQIEQIKALPPGRGQESREKMMDILNDDQKEVLENARERRRR